MKYSAYIIKAMPMAFSLITFMVLTCNTAFGINPPTCTTAKIGCWMEGITKHFDQAITSITIQQTLVKKGEAYFCKIHHTPKELKELCKKANPGRKGVKVQVPIQTCSLMHPDWMMNGYYAPRLRVCFIPIHE